ncbi:glutamine synthetase [bacterium]|nr:glutamine synthetase [bacterium]
MDKRQEILKLAKKEKIRFIRLWFTDILGFLKSFAITIDELEEALYEGKGFDGSSVEGFARIDESDMVALPDPDTFVILPWGPSSDIKVARMFCDIKNPDGSAYDGDPRYVLKRILKKVKDMGYTFYVGPELEYFYFKNSQPKAEPIDFGGYFDLTPMDIASDLRKKTVIALQSMGIPVEYSHHEVAPSQHEIDLRYRDALTMADTVMTYRLVVKEIALQNGVYATFMPKPIFGENGSGMHINMSLFKGKKNVFFDKNDKLHLSKIARDFIAGLMKHAQEVTSITNQWVNSYKRLVPGYEAPIYISWAQKNRSDLIRIPMYKPGREKSTRVEYRAPDPACNPYLAFSIMLAAGLEGMEKGYKLKTPIERNVYEIGKEERKKLGIDTLPGDLYEAVLLTSKSKLVKETLGDHVFNKFLENKKIEWNNYRAQVTSYEMDRYYSIL